MSEIYLDSPSLTISSSESSVSIDIIPVDGSDGYLVQYTDNVDVFDYNDPSNILTIPSDSKLVIPEGDEFGNVEIIPFGFVGGEWAHDGLFTFLLTDDELQSGDISLLNIAPYEANYFRAKSVGNTPNIINSDWSIVYDSNGGIYIAGDFDAHAVSPVRIKISVPFDDTYTYEIRRSLHDQNDWTIIKTGLTEAVWYDDIRDDGSSLTPNVWYDYQWRITDGGWSGSEVAWLTQTRHYGITIGNGHVVTDSGDTGEVSDRPKFEVISEEFLGYNILNGDYYQWLITPIDMPINQDM